MSLPDFASQSCIHQQFLFRRESREQPNKAQLFITFQSMLESEISHIHNLLKLRITGLWNFHVLRQLLLLQTFA
jgi:hypothetical protein